MFSFNGTVLVYSYILIQLISELYRNLIRNNCLTSQLTNHPFQNYFQENWSIPFWNPYTILTFLHFYYYNYTLILYLFIKTFFSSKGFFNSNYLFYFYISHFIPIALNYYTSLLIVISLEIAVYFSFVPYIPRTTLPDLHWFDLEF